MVYLFHLIDLVDERAVGILSQHVATFKLPLAQRMDIVRRILAAFATQRVSTTRDLFAGARSHPGAAQRLRV